MILSSILFINQRTYLSLLLFISYSIQLGYMYKEKIRLIKGISIVCSPILILVIYLYFKEFASYRSMTTITQLYTSGSYSVYQSLTSLDGYNLNLFVI